ncbi:hypothetical protein BRAO375_1250007 [Bradyrhizobium sp. ORS 375]|nr:hypothetical protein BRAO375_1250007 [Bradyrhizobium sp. ORS 375]
MPATPLHGTRPGPPGVGIVRRLADAKSCWPPYRGDKIYMAQGTYMSMPLERPRNPYIGSY